MCKLSKQEIRQYLERIGLTEKVIEGPKDLELLKTLQYAHVTHIPYENIDIMRSVRLDLSLDGLFDKIVTRKRGGYCFELNSLFNALLVSIGYTTVNCFARYLRGATEIPMRRHRIIIASSDDMKGRAFADVGIGERAPKEALCLEENTLQTAYGEEYRFGKEDFYGWVLWDRHRGEWEKFISFTEEPQIEEDYWGTSYFCEAAPESYFKTEMMLSLKTATGRITVAGDKFRIFDGDNVTETAINNENEFNAILKKYYDIIL